MGRARQPEIRERLLAACTDHALAHGLPERLEPFAAASGASARVLLYHFGTKEALQREVLHAARARQRRDVGDLLAPRPGQDYLEVLARAWPAITGPERRGYLELFGRLREDAEQRLWPGFRLVATTDWLTPLAEGLAAVGREDLATLVLAALRGLVMDLEATGDAARTGRAWADLVAALRTVLADASTAEPARGPGDGQGSPRPITTASRRP